MFLPHTKRTRATASSRSLNARTTSACAGGAGDRHGRANDVCAADLGNRERLRAPSFTAGLAHRVAARKLASLLPVTQGGIGVREAALAALAAPFGAPPAMTVAVGLVWETIIIVGGLVAGIIAYGLGARRGTRHSWTSICHEKSR